MKNDNRKGSALTTVPNTFLSVVLSLKAVLDPLASLALAHASTGPNSVVTCGEVNAVTEVTLGISQPSKPTEQWI